MIKSTHKLLIWMTIETILLDYDNTLHDSDSKYIKRLGEPARLLGLSGRDLLEIYLIKVHWGIVHPKFPERHDDVKFHSELILSLLGRPPDEQFSELLVEGIMRAEEECYREPAFFSDAFPFLNRVAREYRLCLSSSDHAREKAECVERVGGIKYFERVFGTHNILHHKTKPEYYREVLELSGSAPERTVSIGDALSHDIIPAKAVGIRTIWVNRRGQRAPEGAEPEYEVKDLLGAIEAIRKLNSKEGR